MKKTPPKKKPNPVAKGLSDFKPRVVPDKTRYKRKHKHKKGDEDQGENGDPYGT